jgi:hypothetical protein
MEIIKNIFTKRISKGVVDILLFIGLFVSIVSSRSTEHSWWTFHCIVSIVWYLLMLIHIWQHWKMTKLLLKFNPKALKRNKITLMLIIVFILMTFSIISFITGVSDNLVYLHHKVTHIFWALLIIHIIVKWKQFLMCFR